MSEPERDVDGSVGGDAGTRRRVELESEVLRIAQPPPDDIEARRWRTAVEQRLFGTPGRREAIGRYTILGKLGEGAHGVVYEAFDPELERAVALKLVRVGDLHDDAASSQRLLQEARALARLKHPHVVAVHDAGRDQAGIFIAMELVEGTTLRRWIASYSPHRLDRILEVFTQAARGLEAAHRASLVHRDFKPENVLVGDDGRVRVSDFGLAQSRIPDEHTPEDTRTRMIVGTPAYMSPEQRAGRTADHRSDQFSFCVALLEAVQGRRPDLDRIETEIDRPGERRIPRWLKRILRRGLSRDPAARYDQMGALLRELERRWGRSRRAKTASVLAVLILCALSIVIALDRSAAPLCDPAEAAALWSPETVERAHQAFVRSGVEGAEETWTRVDALTRRRVDGWRVLAEEVCRGASDQERARALCLGWQLHELRAFGAVMTAADAGVVEHAMVAVHELPDPSRCVVAEWDVATVAATDGQRENADEVHALVANARVRFEAGQLVEALHASAEALGRAQALGSRPLEAEALLVRGRAAAALHGSKDIETIDPETTLYAAMLAAEAGRHPSVVAGALVELTIWTVGQRHFESAELWSQRALHVLEQMPGESRLAARLYWGLSVAEAWQKRMDVAYAHLDRAVDLLGDAPYDPLLWRFLNQSGELAYANADYARARSAYEQSLEVITAHVGREHLWFADVNGNLGEVAAAQHRVDEARAHFEIALGIRRRMLGDESYWVLHTLAHLGDMHLRSGDLDRAREAYETVLAGPTKDDPSACDRQIWARHGLALIALERNDFEEALRIADATRHASPKDELSHLDLCDRFDVYALALLAGGRPHDALAHLEAIGPRLEANAGPEHRAMVPLLVAEAEALHTLGRDDESRARLERARAIHELDGANAPDVTTRAQKLADQL